MARVIWEVVPYNTRRYSKPWLAKVMAWPIGKPPTLSFGGTVGELMAEINAEPGELLKRGQRDNRGNNTINEFCIATEGGETSPLTTQAARDYWLTKAEEKK